jgi:CopG family transcriptional regulator/antitoxin EndoAI
MHRRLNITLPERTVRLLDRVARRGSRSGVIAAAVERYAEDVSRTSLRRALKAGALARAERDRDVVEAWFAIDDEAWAGRRR